MNILISIIVFLSIFVSYPLYAQSAFKNKSKRAPLVEVKKVKIFNIAEKTNTIGRSVAINPTIISSKINQEIQKIHFKIGDNVKKMIYYSHLTQKIYLEILNKYLLS